VAEELTRSLSDRLLVLAFFLVLTLFGEGVLFLNRIFVDMNYQDCLGGLSPVPTRGCGGLRPYPTFYFHLSAIMLGAIVIALVVAILKARKA